MYLCNHPKEKSLLMTYSSERVLLILLLIPPTFLSKLNWIRLSRKLEPLTGACGGLAPRGQDATLTLPKNTPLTLGFILVHHGDMQPTIALLDLDAFFASVEMALD